MIQGTSPAADFHPEQFSKSDYAQLLEVIEACDVGLCMLDAEMRVLAWNRRLADIVGKESAEVLGRPVEGEYAEEFSLAPVASSLTELLGSPVRLERHWEQGLQIDHDHVDRTRWRSWRGPSTPSPTSC